MHSEFIVLLLISSLPSVIFSQGVGNNLIGGEFRVDRLSYEESLDGVRRDIDIGIQAKYLRSLFPVHTNDSIHYKDIIDNKKPLSRHWAGIVFGLSGYYVNSDSVIIQTTDISFGPTLRYYATEQIFLESTGLFLYSWSQIRTPDPISPGNWYIPWTEFAGLKWQLGAGFSKRLARNVFLEPMVGYRIYWRWYATHSKQRSYELYDVTHGFSFSLCLQFSFR